MGENWKHQVRIRDYAIIRKPKTEHQVFFCIIAGKELMGINFLGWPGNGADEAPFVTHLINIVFIVFVE